MSRKAKLIYNELINALAEKAMPLSPDEYRDLLEELKAHINGLIECQEEEEEEGDEGD